MTTPTTPSTAVSDIIQDVSDQMGVTFYAMSTLLRSRHKSPANYNLKVRFWSTVIHTVCTKNGLGLNSRYTIDAHQLPRTLAADRVYPLGFPGVLNHLVNHDHALSTVSDFLHPPPSNSSLFQRWNVSALISSTLSWSLSTLGLYSSLSLPDLTEANGITEGIFVLHDRVQIDIEHIRSAIDSITCLTDSIMHKDELFRLSGLYALISATKDSSTPGLDAELLLSAAQRQNLLAFDPISNLVKVIWRPDPSGASSLTISPFDRDLYNLKRTAKSVTSHVTTLESRINSLTDQAREHIRTGRKPAALQCLATRKKLEPSIDKQRTTLETLTTMIAQIDSANSQTAVMSAFQSGSSALRTMLSNPLLQSDTINSTMDEVLDVLADHQDMEDAVTTNMNLIQNDLPIDDDELESELAALVAADHVPNTPLMIHTNNPNLVPNDGVLSPLKALARPSSNMGPPSPPDPGSSTQSQAASPTNAGFVLPVRKKPRTSDCTPLLMTE